MPTPRKRFFCTHHLEYVSGPFYTKCSVVTCDKKAAGVSITGTKRVRGVCFKCRAECVQAHSSAVDLRDPNDQKDELDLDYFPETTATERACIEIELDDLELLHALPPDVQLDCNSITTLLRLYLNLSVLLNSLPPQSPNRKELYRYLSDGLSTETATKWLQTSRATIYRSRQSTEEDGTLSLNAIGYKRPRKVSNLDEMHIAFDELCPIQSGRDYRIKSASTQIMFKRYREIAKEPMGRTAFYNMMAAARVRKVIQTQCPHCIEFKNLNSLPMPLTEEQCMIWEKNHSTAGLGPRTGCILQGEGVLSVAPKSVLIVMDFANIESMQLSFELAPNDHSTATVTFPGFWNFPGFRQHPS